MKIFHSILFLSIAFVSCRHDPPLYNVTVDGECYENNPNLILSDNNGIDTFKNKNACGIFYFEYEILYDQQCDYWWPSFNPNNANEICYIRKAPPSSELWKYNFCTRKATKICDGAFYSTSWSIKDWIIFTGTDLQVHKVKSNGDSLTQLTFAGTYNNYPVWNPDGTKFFFCRLSSSQFFIGTESGILTDTFYASDVPIYPHNWEWVDENKIAFIHESQTNDKLNLLVEWDLNTHNSVLLENFPWIYSGGNYMPPGTDELFCYDKQSATYYLSQLIAIHSFKSTTGILNSFNYGGDNRAYSALDISLDNKKICISRIDCRQVGCDTIYRQQNLYLMNTDGSDERKIIFK